MDGMTWMASAMRAAQSQLDTATHNLANVASDGFRRIHSSLTLTGHGLVTHESPDPSQGGIRETGRTLDLALIGPGTFKTTPVIGPGASPVIGAGAFRTSSVTGVKASPVIPSAAPQARSRGTATILETRNGAFIRDRNGYLADQTGRRVLGTSGPIRLSETARVQPDGTIRDAGRVVGRLPLPPGTTVRSGALESSSVDAIGETLAVLTAQRAFETAQKTLVAIDQTREKAVNDVVRLK
jgi:flagellar basal body rod protein FlgG